MERPREYDVVELTRDVDGRPRGTDGTLVDILDREPDYGYVEVADGDGVTLDLFVAPLNALRVLTRT